MRISFAILLIVLSSGICAQESGNPDKSKESQNPQQNQAQSDAPLNAFIEVPVQIRPAEGEQISQKTPYEEEDIAIQSRMAEATEDQATWLIAEAVLLFFTAFFAFIAVVQTRSAAKSAKEFVRHQNMGQCAWLATQSMKVERLLPGTDPDPFVGFQFRFPIKNCGNTPANNVRIWTDARKIAGQVNAEALAFSKTGEARQNAIGPNTGLLSGRILVSEDELFEAAHGRLAILFWVRIEYEDIFGIGHETETTAQCAYMGEVELIRDHNARPEDLKFSNVYIGPGNFIR